MSISISGNGSFTGVTADYSFDQSVGIAGTLSYEDVTSVDSIGIITAQNGVEVTGGTVTVGADPNDGVNIGTKLTTTGVVQATRPSGSSAVFMGYTQNNSTPRIRLNGDGSGYLLGDVGIGTNTTSVYASPARNLVVYADTNSGMTIRSGTNSDGGIYFNDTDDANQRGIVRYNHQSDALAFHTPFGEVLRLSNEGRILIDAQTTRSNLFGITWTSRIQVEADTDQNTSASFICNGGGNNQAGLIVLGSSSSSTAGGNGIVDDYQGLGIFSFQGGTGTTMFESCRVQGSVDGSATANGVPGRLRFSTCPGTGNVEDRLVIDSTGNSTFKKNVLLDDASGVIALNPGGNAGSLLITRSGKLTTNVTTSGTSNVGGVSGGGSSINMSSNTGIRFSTFSSTTSVGDAITEVERMRIDSAGRLLVGTDSNSVNSTIVAEGNTGNSAGSAELYLQRGTTTPPDGTSLGSILFADNISGIGANITAIRDGGTWSGSSKPTYVSIQTTGNGASAPTERARFTSVGFSKFTNTGGYYSVTSPYHELYSGGSNSNNNQVLSVYHAGAVGTQYGILIRTANDQNDSSRYFLNCVGSGTPRALIYTNGGLANYQANNTNLCDVREKKNIQATTSTWDYLKNWEIKKFRYNEDDDSTPLKYGVIAQQIEEVNPELISPWTKQEAKEAVLDENGVVTQAGQDEILRKGVKEQQMTWIAIKALQEAMEKIETLEAKVQALEGS